MSLRNCTTCKYFTSYREDYNDVLEPDDQGFCKHSNHEGDYADSDIICLDYRHEDKIK